MRAALTHLLHRRPAGHGGSMGLPTRPPTRPMRLLPPALQLARPRCSTPICACRTKSPSRCASTRQGGAGGEHGQLLRIHRPVQGAGRAVQPLQGQGWWCWASRPTISRRKRAATRRLPTLRKHLRVKFPMFAKTSRVRGRRVALYKQLAQLGHGAQVELPQIPAGPRWPAGGQLFQHDRP